jgi:O-antigen/teichoic acid export membrane protein
LETLIASSIGVSFVALGLARTKVIAESGGPEFFAWFSFFGAVATFAVTVGALGLPFGLQRDAAIRGEAALQGAHRTLAISTLSTGLVAVLLTFAFHREASSNSLGVSDVLFVVVGLAVYEVARATGVPTLQAVGRTRDAAHLAFALILASALIAVVPTAVFGEHALSIGTLLSAGVALVATRRATRPNRVGDGRADVTSQRRLMSVGVWSIGAGGLVLVAMLLIRWALVRDVSSGAAAEFFAATALFTLIRAGVLSATSSVIHAEWSASSGSIDTKARTSILLVGVASMVVVVVSSIQPLVSLLFSAAFELNLNVILPLGLAAVVEAWVWAAEAPVVVGGRFRAWLLGPAIGLILTAMLVLIGPRVTASTASVLTLFALVARACVVIVVLRPGPERARALRLARPTWLTLAALTVVSLLSF